LIKKDIKKGKKIIEELLEWLEVPQTDSTKDTPERVAKMYLEIFEGLHTKPPQIKTFQEGEPYSYVCISNNYFTSFCSHHLLPFTGKCGIVYVVNDSGIVIGLSKIPRIINYFSSKPQLQEILTKEIAEYIMKTLKPLGLYIVMSGRHSCMEIRGVKAKGSITNTAVMRGDIDKEEAIRLLQINNFFGD
jgi:GTP cyclohydrolase I